MLSVIIPASNEETFIGPCLTALFASTGLTSPEVIIVANGCQDATAARAESHAGAALAAGWRLTVISLTKGHKPTALNAGDAAATGEIRAYLDADVIVTPSVMAELVQALTTPAPLYASATPRIPRAKSRVTRAYARFWLRLPFAQSAAPGYGLFATNPAGRARWGDFPAIISDDTFVRLQFIPAERVQTPAPYDWPMIEGFAALTRVRRRQNAGVAEIECLYPGLLAREGKPALTSLGLARLVLADPVAFCTYAAVSLAVRFAGKSTGWTRGR
jgi:hypothetical protein